MLEIKLYNTLTRTKEVFKPVKDGEVSMYACGPTVYNFIHIGNARPFILFDIYRRFLKYVGYKVTYAQNITDIDDKIIEKANEEGRTAEEVAKEFTDEFLEDLNRLGVEPPDHAPKATEYIGKMIKMIKKLVDDGFAYNSDGNVFFEVAKFKEYGKLSNKDLENVETGDRVTDEIQGMKKDPVRDFSLWKPAKPGEPSWGSPWGKGRPGWHTECVAMSTDIFGEKFDIHTGGIDLIFPHHENEVAQAKCAANADFATYWMHNEFLNMKDTKMSKSLGNVVLARELSEKFSREAIRLFFLQSHYRSPINFSTDLVQNAENAIKKIRDIHAKIKQHLEPLIASNPGLPDFDKEPVPEKIVMVYKSIIDAMADDFNSPTAMGHYFQFIKLLSNEVNKGGGTLDYSVFLHHSLKFLKDIDLIFGIFPKVEIQVDREAVDKLVAERETARQNKDWGRSDEIRDELSAMGVVLEDSKDGVRWFVKTQ